MLGLICTFVLNRALCYLSVKMYKEAVRDCGEALQLDPANIKALYRQAQAHKELKVRGFPMNKKCSVYIVCTCFIILFDLC